MRETADHLTLVTFYRVVVQEVILFVAETWVISMTTEKRISGVHMIFLQQVTWKRAKRSSYGTWRQEGSESALKVAGTQEVRMFIDRRQEMVAQWVALRPIFEVCAQQETSYKGGGRRRPLWWRKTEVDAQLRVILGYISAEVR